jgi:hypothetical protein
VTGAGQLAAEVAPGYEVPGWFFLRARRHAAKLTGLAGGRDVPAAQAVAGDVRLAYEEIVRGREHAAVG